MTRSIRNSLSPSPGKEILAGYMKERPSPLGVDDGIASMGTTLNPRRISSSTPVMEAPVSIRA